MSNQQQPQYRRRSETNDIGPGDKDDDELSIIDVFEFDDTANDRWLCSTGTASRRNSAETKIEDLDAWLHADLPESEVSQFENGSRRSIDTRTFTRTKRRSNRLNFESTEASVSPEIKQYSLSNIWKNHKIPESPVNINNNNEEKNMLKERRDNIPMMLRPKTNQVLAALLSESPTSISSQTSMEAFINMAGSKEGFNSLISDMSDPDVSHFLMNISQPSLLYSSIISDGKGDESINVAKRDSFTDSQILSDSMMEASMFKEVQDTSMIADFLKQSNDCTVLENKTFCKSPHSLDPSDKTFVNDGLSDKTYVNQSDDSPNGTYVKNSNDTFSLPSPIHKIGISNTRILSSQENLLDVTQTINNSKSTPLNSTKTISHDHNTILIENEDVLSSTHTINNENKTDLTFDLKLRSPNEKRLDATFETSNFSGDRLSSESSEHSEKALDATFNAVPNLRAELLQEVKRSSIGHKFDTTFTNVQLPNTETKFDVTYNQPNPVEPFEGVKSLDATYVHMPSLHQRKPQSDKRCLDVTYDSTQLNAKLNNANDANCISYIKKNPVEMPASDRSRFNTFRKDTKMGNRFSHLPKAHEDNSSKLDTTVVLQSQMSNAKSNDNLYQQRFNTFSKKTRETFKNSLHTEKIVDQSKSNDKFVKPPDKLRRQIPAPRQLSKLPQFFQTSNPNLGSSSKPLERLTLDSESRFNKGSQPNIARMQSLGRFKSEQRLLQTKHNTELGDSTSRSMESIESSASVHSAPDLDDRLSVCSNNSKASYTIKPRNIEALKKLASMEEQCGKLGGSTPKIKDRPVFENTWVEEKDLPSPILKNGVGKSCSRNDDGRNISPIDNAEYNAKTSSPLNISPSSSDQAINAIGIEDCGVEATKENIQATENIKPKPQLKAPSTTSNTTTKLRRPTNWTGGPNKAANGAVSGIPRPASRIPAPKFARSNLK